MLGYFSPSIKLTSSIVPSTSLHESHVSIVSPLRFWIRYPDFNSVGVKSDFVSDTYVLNITKETITHMIIVPAFLFVRIFCIGLFVLSVLSGGLTSILLC